MAGNASDAAGAVHYLVCAVAGCDGCDLRREGKLPSDLAIATFGDNELLDFLQCPVLAVAQRHRDVAERVLEIVLASLDEPRKPKPGLTRIKRNLYRRGILSRH
jgi:LacI family fructose operon transcriptional repressor